MKINEILQIQETSEENQILNLVVRRVVNKIVSIIKSDKTWKAAFFSTSAFSDYDRLTIFGVKLSSLNLPKTNNKIVDEFLSKINVQVTTSEADDTTYSSMADFDLGNSEIRLHISNIIKYCLKHGKDVISVIESSLIHELQHAMDKVKSSGKAFNVPNVNAGGNDSSKYEAYLKLPYEVNARFAQALLAIQGMIDARIDIRTAITKALKDYELDELTPKIYKRLSSRAFKFYDAHSNSPKKIENDKSLMARAKNWILGKSTEEIK